MTLLAARYFHLWLKNLIPSNPVALFAKYLRHGLTPPVFSNSVGLLDSDLFGIRSALTGPPQPYSIPRKHSEKLAVIIDGTLGLDIAL